ncbi:MAG: molybdopterin molybdotransferase MoeA, partial [Pseudolabrys sp.]|nr:molybdopterin molybdotransferase MoeA [Pseudolabrys sp.]
RFDDILQVPVELQVIGEAAAGHPFPRQVGTGECARIFTGGVLPPGTDTVVIQEDTARTGAKITIKATTKRGRHVRTAGIDFKQGETLLRAGHPLTDRDLMLAAGMNYPALAVYRLPVVAILGTGDELVPPGSSPKEGEIIYSSGYALSPLIRATPARVIELGVAKDRVEDIVACIRRAREAKADVLLTTGGASVGEHDLVQKALASEGLELSFWKIAMRPGKPMMHGRLGTMHVLGVPGNPVSSYVCTFLFLRPLLRRLAGRSELHAQPLCAVLGRDLPQNDERAEYMRASLEKHADGALVATPFPNQDSSLMAPLARADCLVIREPHAQSARAGSPCVILKLGL